MATALERQANPGGNPDGYFRVPRRCRSSPSEPDGLPIAAAGPADFRAWLADRHPPNAPMERLSNLIAAATRAHSCRYTRGQITCWLEAIAYSPQYSITSIYQAGGGVVDDDVWFAARSTRPIPRSPVLEHLAKQEEEARRRANAGAGAAGGRKEEASSA